MLNITITIEANNLEEAKLAGEEAIRRMVDSGCVMGFDENETSSFHFDVDGEEEVEESEEGEEEGDDEDEDQAHERIYTDIVPVTVTYS